MISNFLKRRKNNVVVLLLLITLVCSCKRNRLKINVSDIELELQIKRFEKDLFSVKLGNAAESFSVVKKKYPLFFHLFTNNIIRIGNEDPVIASNNLQNFISDPEIKEIQQDVSAQFQDINFLEKDLSLAFKHYKYYFPEKLIPELITFISGFNYSIVSADSILGIGLDMYLGENNKYYGRIGLPKYKTRKMRKEYIVRDCMKGWIESEYIMNTSKNDFISHMIHNGKSLYFLDAVLPDASDSLKIGYTAEQLEFCKENEANIWAFFIEKKLLFSTDELEYLKYVNEGPTTSGMPKESPGMIGNWIGWQIVRTYMNRNPEVSLQQLMKNQDPQIILTKSKYKPKR